jgi:hypothetical protein
MNIVSMIMQFLTPALISRIASGLGADNTLVGKAIAAALPAILAGVVGKAASPDGLRSLTGALAQQDGGLLGNLTNILGGPQQAALADNGGNMLGSLLGGTATTALAGAVGKFTGLGDGATKGLLGILAPVVLGSLANQQKTNNLDAAGLASMLMGQKSNIQAAMPAGFADLLGGSGLLDGVNAPSMGGAAMSAANNAAKTATSAATNAASQMQNKTMAAAEKASGSSGWLPWLIGLAALALVGWYLFGGAGAPKPMTDAMAPMTKIMAGNVDVGAQVTGLFDGLKSTVGSIKDKATAEAALPKLQEAAAQVTALNATAATLPADGKKGLAQLVASLLPVIQPLITSALGSADASGVVKPVLDTILGGLTTLSKG